MDVALQRLVQLEHDEVLRIIEASAALAVRHRRPLPSDDSEEDVTIGDGSLDRPDEVLPRGNGVDVDEHARVVEPRGDPIGQSPSGISGLLAPVAEKDAALPGHS
ncbi:hypothetical protein [Nocardioides sp. CER19]|uniref:hypothetical protein n=1 Tax=Nocardioides sp. CER19 TaxID=3038538 RepID=UPI00244B211F|nr:hypothetical protein [Nocardioides sp. CER19]MDH2414458.1 hypothetical protein [Nocardioides sp. CER19]